MQASPPSIDPHPYPYLTLSESSITRRVQLHSNIQPTCSCLSSTIVQQDQPGPATDQSSHFTVTMPWWPSSSSPGSGSSRGDGSRRPVSWTDSLNGTDWEHYKDPRNWIPTVLVTTTVVASLQIYRSYLRRIPGAVYVQPSFFRRRSVFGQVTSVGDGDNFHLFHTPGGRLAGWGWLRSVPTKRAELKNRTVWPIFLVQDTSKNSSCTGLRVMTDTSISEDTYTPRRH